MNIRNINKTIYTNGGTSDIIRVVMMAYDIENDPQIYELAEQLKGSTVVETCRNIWLYLVENINYKADSDGDNGEMVRTPARLVHDATGDCKSYSLFTAVILRYLKIQHVFRFVSYGPAKEATHVYVVAFDKGREIVVDAVAKQQLNYDFGFEKKYTYRCDMAKGGTKISYLAGFKPTTNKIGSTDTNSDDRYKIWIGNENETDITPGKAWLYGRYDLLNEMIGISKTSAETAKLYDELSVITAMIWGYNHVQGDTAECRKIALIISGMVHDGAFTNKSIVLSFRDVWFDSLIDVIESRYNAGLQPTVWNVNVLQNFITNVLESNELPERTGISGVSGWTPIADALKKAGIYFLYLFIPDSELAQYPESVAKKRKTQKFFFELIHKVDIFHKAATVQEFFRAGIIARTGMQPEDYIKKVKAGNVKVGSFLVVASAIIGIVLGLLQIIKMIWPQSEAANYAVSSGAADMENELYTTKTKTTSAGYGNTSSDITAYLPLIGAGLVGVFLITRNNTNN